MTPLALWTHVLLKSGEAVLDTMQAAVERSRQRRVAVIPTADAPQPRAPREAKKAPVKAKGKSKPKARAQGARKRKARSR